MQSRSWEPAAIGLALGLALAAPLLAAGIAVSRTLPNARVMVIAVGALLGIMACRRAVSLCWRKLPQAVDGAFRRRPGVAIAWTVLAVLLLIQMVRLSAFMVNPALTWGAAVPDPNTIRHQCMSAYVHAADLSRQGEPNIYDAAHYPAFVDHSLDLVTPTPVAELGPYIDDPFEYPPPFLLLPRLGLALTNHYLVLRAVWFAVQILAVAALALGLAGWIGGRKGLVAGLLLPAVFISLPTMLNFQWGQFHLIALAMAMGAMVAFDRERPAVGGLLLAAATLAKIFPGILLIYLAFERRWREIIWSLAFAALLALAGWIVLGPQPYIAFFRYHLPRVASGEAFSFFQRSYFYISRNMSIYGIAYKLRELGVPGMSARLASLVSWIYTGVLILLAWAGARHKGDRLAQACIWLGLLNLAALRSPLAPSAYVAAGVLWLLSLLALQFRTKLAIAVLVLGWILIAGLPPLPRPSLEIVCAMVGQLLAIATCLWAVLRPARAPVR